MNTTIGILSTKYKILEGKNRMDRKNKKRIIRKEGVERTGMNIKERRI